jgi:hypothetical protein
LGERSSFARAWQRLVVSGRGGPSAWHNPTAPSRFLHGRTGIVTSSAMAKVLLRAGATQAVLPLRVTATSTLGTFLGMSSSWTG